MRRFFEPVDQDTLSAQVHQNEITGHTRSLNYKINLPVSCRLEFPADPAFERDTSVSLSLIRAGLIGWTELSGTSFRFPVNPTPGYVDGSICFAEQHHSVDLIRLRFGSLREDPIETGLSMVFNFYQMPELPQLPSQFNVNWRVKLRLDIKSIDQALAEARGLS